MVLPFQAVRIFGFFWSADWLPNLFPNQTLLITAVCGHWPFDLIKGKLNFAIFPQHQTPLPCMRGSLNSFGAAKCLRVRLVKLWTLWHLHESSPGETLVPLVILAIWFGWLGESVLQTRVPDRNRQFRLMLMQKYAATYTKLFWIHHWAFFMYRVWQLFGKVALPWVIAATSCVLSRSPTCIDSLIFARGGKSLEHFVGDGGQRDDMWHRQMTIDHCHILPYMLLFTWRP